MEELSRFPKSSIRSKITMALVLVVVIWGIALSHLLQRALYAILARRGLSQEIFGEIANRFTLISTGLTLAGIILFAFVAAYFSRAVTRPLKELTEGVAGIATGDRNVRIRIQGNDEFGQLSAAFNRMVEDLGKLDRLKNEFVSTVSHELRTPLATITGYAELLQEEGFSPAQRQEFLAEIQLKLDSLSELIEELLDISRLEEGLGLKLNPTRCNARDILAGPVLEYQRRTDRHRIDLVLPEEPLPLRIDRLKVERVLENLLSNAIKYSPQGGCIRVVGTRDSAGRVQISVSDQGIGMTPQQVARVFDKFYRVDPCGTAVGGVGLGMSIARNIVEAHGGAIRVESAPGAGTTVTFCLPLDGENTPEGIAGAV